MSPSVVLVLVVVSAALAASEPATPPESPTARAQALRVAVYDFELSGVEPRMGRVVTDSVVAELRKLQHTSVIGMDEVRAMLDLEAQKQLVGCEADESCLAEIADALGVDVLIIGTLARLEDQSIFGLRRIDQRRAQVVGTVNQRLVPANGEEFLAAVGPAVAEVFPDVPLRPGKTRGVDPEMALRLNPPPLPPWLCWSGLGTSSVLAVGALVTGALHLSARQGYKQNVAFGKEQGIPWARLEAQQQEVNTWAYATWGLTAGAALTALATGGVALFTDFHGYRHVEE